MIIADADDYCSDRMEITCCGTPMTFGLYTSRHEGPQGHGITIETTTRTCSRCGAEFRTEYRIPEVFLRSV